MRSVLLLLLLLLPLLLLVLIPPKSGTWVLGFRLQRARLPQTRLGFGSQQTARALPTH